MAGATVNASSARTHSEAHANARDEAAGSKRNSGPLRNGGGALIPNVLVVDDDEIIRHQLKRLYEQNGYSVAAISSAEAAVAQLVTEDIDFVITDIKLPGMSGLQLISHLHSNHPDVPVIAVTGYSDIETAVRALKLGASDFVVKPFELGTVQEATRVALERSNVYMEIRHLRRWLKDRSIFGGMLSKTEEMHRVFETIRMVGPTDMTVLIQGETGTGKELVASAVHFQSRRCEAPYVTINCAGFPESLLESELFGYEKGAFTGADHAKEGKIELAHKGTLFLDEIESMSVVMQGKLLRVLEDQKVQRLGGNATKHVDMRVIAASNVPLIDMVAEGKMRADFYYRINVIPIHLLPLRHRKVDIPLLVHDFIRHHPLAIEKEISAISKGVMEALMGHTWLGNIRELQNVLERAIVLAKGRVIERIDLPDAHAPVESLQDDPAVGATLEDWMNEQEKRYLAKKLEAFGGNVALTAKSCGIGVRTLSRKIQLHKLDRRSFKHKNPVSRIDLADG